MDKSKLKISAAWQALANHASQMVNLSIKEQFALNPKRFFEFSLKHAGVFLDYSKNRIVPETMKLLCNLADAVGVMKYRDQMFYGSPINVTEKRKVLHTALRDLANNTTVEGKLVKKELKRITKLVQCVRSGKWLGYSGKPITDVVNIGIGGSDLGPAMIVAALQPYVSKIKTHFVSNLDPTHISETLKCLNPETTLFIVASKTFTTQETLVNAQAAKEWLLHRVQKGKEAIARHFIGVTAHAKLALAFGISADNIFSFWDWVGGRFSLWSAIGIPIALAIGMENFYELLQGAYEMDDHFRHAPNAENLPIILALLGIWNTNFLGMESLAVIPYDQYLYLFPSYLQQLEMESNGKRVDIHGNPVTHKTAPIVWGAVGTNSQHSFHQLLMQGTRQLSVDFIVSLSSHHPIGDNQLLLYANCLAQSRALMCGVTEDEVVLGLKQQKLTTAQISKLKTHKVIPGNVPSNTIVVPELNPKTLGAMIALYEHKVFVQGVIWQINSFDQWGVELGKQIANKLIPLLQGKGDVSELDGSTQGLITLRTSGSLQS